MQQLGYQPRTMLRDGLPVVARWYEQHQAPGR
jgi:hypothetical protein